MGFALFAAFAYGPLEVFYITFLTVRIEEAFGTTPHSLISRETIITSILFGLLHVGNVTFFGLLASLMNVAKGFLFSLILMAVFRYTGCSLGSMLYWTFANLT